MNDDNHEEDDEDEVTDNDEGAMQVTKNNYNEEDNAEGEANDGDDGQGELKKRKSTTTKNMMVQRGEATTANKKNYDEVDDNDKEEMATVKIEMKGAAYD